MQPEYLTHADKKHSWYLQRKERTLRVRTEDLC